MKRKKHSLIVVIAEGDETGGADKISQLVKIRFPNYDMKVSILGHIQRGGSPSCADRVLASRLGVAAVEAMLQGKRNVMVGEVKNEIIYTPLEEVVKRRLPVTASVLDMIKVLSS